MAKLVQQTAFFSSARKECRLNKYELLEVIIDGEEKKRSKLNVEIPLSNKPVIGMPDWLSEPFSEMAKDDSLISRIKLDAICKGMTIEVFSSEKIRRRTLMSTGVKIGNFSLVATGEGEKREVVLEAVIYVPANVELHTWAWDHIHKVFFADFDYSQSEMVFDGASDEDSEEEETAEVAASGEQDDDENSAAAVAARARKPYNGKAIQATLN